MFSLVASLLAAASCPPAPASCHEQADLLLTTAEFASPIPTPAEIGCASATRARARASQTLVGDCDVSYAYLTSRLPESELPPPVMASAARGKTPLSCLAAASGAPFGVPPSLAPSSLQPALPTALPALPCLDVAPLAASGLPLVASVPVRRLERPPRA